MDNTDYRPSSDADVSDFSCVQHTSNYFLQLRQDYVKLFDGDHCLALLTHFFEFRTDGEMQRNRLHGKPKEPPYIKASIPTITVELMGCFSQRTIHDKIKTLKALSIISSTNDVPGTVGQYVLNFDNINTCLKNRMVFTEKIQAKAVSDYESTGVTYQCNFAVVQSSPSVLTLAKTTVDIARVSIYKREGKTTPYSPPGDSPEPLPSPPEVCIRDVIREAPQGRQWRESIKRLCGNFSPSSVLSGMHTFLAGNKPNAEHFERWLEAGNRDGHSRPLRERHGSNYTFATVGTKAEDISPSGDALEAIREWERLNPDMRVTKNQWPLISSAVQDVDFTKNMPIIFDKCRRLRAMGDGWVTMGWLLKANREDGLYGWQKILAGTMDFKLGQEPEYCGPPAALIVDDWDTWLRA